MPDSEAAGDDEEARGLNDIGQEAGGLFKTHGRDRLGAHVVMLAIRLQSSHAFAVRHTVPTIMLLPQLPGD